MGRAGPFMLFLRYLEHFSSAAMLEVTLQVRFGNVPLLFLL